MTRRYDRERQCPACKHIAKPFGPNKLLCTVQGCECRCNMELALADAPETDIPESKESIRAMEEGRAEIDRGEYRIVKTR